MACKFATNRWGSHKQTFPVIFHKEVDVSIFRALPLKTISKLYVFLKFSQVSLLSFVALKSHKHVNVIKIASRDLLTRPL